MEGEWHYGSVCTAARRLHHYVAYVARWECVYGGQAPTSHYGEGEGPLMTSDDH